MNNNPYLKSYPQDEVQNLINSGSIIPKIDSYGNLLLLSNSNTIYSSSITIFLENSKIDPIKVETKYNVQFTEL